MELYGKYSAEEADKYWSGIKAEALSIFNLND